MHERLGELLKAAARGLIMSWSELVAARMWPACVSLQSRLHLVKI